MYFFEGHALDRLGRIKYKVDCDVRSLLSGFLRAI